MLSKVYYFLFHIIHLYLFTFCIVAMVTQSFWQPNARVFLQIARFQLTSDQIEQVLGGDLTIAALVNSSASIVSMLVRAYDSSLRQTLSAVQLELRAAQQVAIKNVNTLNQQLTTFNDSTIIGDSFVRYAH